MTKPIESLRPIAITGKFRSGKDSAADHLVSKYGYTRFAFGDGIKRVTRQLYPDAYAGGNKPRALLQGFGQMARGFDENVWVNDCFRRIDGIRVHRKHVAEVLREKFSLNPVISDLRQPNEYDRCRAEGFVIVRVTCPDDVRLERARAAGDNFTADDLSHETESYVDGFPVDYEIINDGTIYELYAKVDGMIADITKEVD